MVSLPLETSPTILSPFRDILKSGDILKQGVRDVDEADGMI